MNSIKAMAWLACALAARAAWAQVPPVILTPPASQTNYSGETVSFTVTARGDAPLQYRWQKNQQPLTDGGALCGSSSNCLTLANLSVADYGTYSVLVSNAAGSASTGAVLTVYSRLVQNGGFEAGDFSRWTRSGSLDDSDSAVGADHAHSGQFGAVLFPSGGLGFLSQALPTVVGESYRISFWLESDYGLTPNECVVTWNGSPVLDLVDVATDTYTNIQLTVSATATNCVLGFGFRNDPSYFGLDDVSVVPVPAFQRAGTVAGRFEGSFDALGGFRYQVQSCTNLDTADWRAWGDGWFAETNATVTLSLPAAAPQQFYRLVLMP